MNCRGWYRRGLINGRTADSFGPDAAISRQEIAVILTRLSSGPWNVADSSAVNGSVRVEAELGLMQGREDGRFVPGAPATRAEMAQAMLNYLVTPPPPPA
ncbi:S-layer homology domain-containing protein [Paenibacillus sp. YN15]|uniref:S-layer homology domain-containing protein n=1 Tax=Paenibacillus sp. YN15 TaxID=1742774 RepID=UPI0015EB7AF4